MLGPRIKPKFTNVEFITSGRDSGERVRRTGLSLTANCRETATNECVPPTKHAKKTKQKSLFHYGLNNVIRLSVALIDPDKGVQADICFK